MNSKNYTGLLRVLTTIFFCFNCLIITAQQLKQLPRVSLDTIHVKADRFIFIEEYAYYARNDTIFVLPDTVEFHIKKNSLEKTDNFYKQVEKKMSKTKVSSLMYQYLFKSTTKEKPQDEELRAQRFSPYQGDKIQDVGFKYLKVFGTDINDTTKNNPTKWTSILNKSHVHTRRWVIRKNLLFKKNDTLDAQSLVDSERLLRRLDFIKDARIYVNDSNGIEKTKLIVASKDVFPYNFLINPNNNNGARFGISNINMGGTGHELEYNNIVDRGSDFYYRIRNVQGTFIDTELNYANYFGKNGYGIRLTRDFITQETKFAGGATYSKYEFREIDYNPITDITNSIGYDLKYKDFWMGKAFKTSIESNFLGLEENTNAVLSARIERLNFSNSPLVEPDANFRFHDRTNYLINLGLTSRVYYKDKFILQFGRAEDIPTGTTFGLVAGYQKAEFRNRAYLGGNFARGGYIPKFGYLNSIFSLGGFISQNGFDDGVFKIGIDYFSKLFIINQFKFRQFVEFNLSQAIKPSEELVLSTQNDLGIRGVANYFLRATNKINVKIESLLFTPVDILGFKMAVLAFFDATASSNSRNQLFNNELFAGMGGGIRLRNDNLAISTIQLRLGYYPKIPINGTTNLFNIATSTNFNIRDFNFKAPEIISFN